MKHSTADKLVYAHESLHLESKLQDASWKPDVERWDTDSDSSCSEEDEEFDLTSQQLLALCM